MQRPPSPPRQLRNSQFRTVHDSQLIEEEKLSHYKPEKFYPVRIGEIFNSQYQVLGKLGYGANSTVWFCRDLSYVSLLFLVSTCLICRSRHRYVAVKVYTRGQIGRTNGEVKTYERLSKLIRLHPRKVYIRELYETFEIHGPDGCHVCLVHPPLHMTVGAVQKHGPQQRYNEVLLRETLLRLFRSLDFLHNVANVVHTGMSEDLIPCIIVLMPNMYWAHFSCRHQSYQYYAHHR